MKWKVGNMPKTNEATDTGLKVIERLQQLGWKRGDAFQNSAAIIT